MPHESCPETRLSARLRIRRHTCVPPAIRASLLQTSKTPAWQNASHLYFTEMDQPLHVVSEDMFRSAMALATCGDGAPSRCTIAMPQRLAKDGNSPPEAKSPTGLALIGQNKCVIGR